MTANLELLTIVCSHTFAHLLLRCAQGGTSQSTCRPPTTQPPLPWIHANACAHTRACLRELTSPPILLLPFDLPPPPHPQPPLHGVSPTPAPLPFTRSSHARETSTSPCHERWRPCPALALHALCQRLHGRPHATPAPPAPPFGTDHVGATGHAPRQ